MEAWDTPATFPLPSATRLDPLPGGAVVPGAEIAVGYIFAWLLRKAGRVGQRADGEVDRALEAGMDRLHEAVSRRLGEDPALQRAGQEVREGRGELSARTRRRLLDSLEDAAEHDGEFAALINRLVAELDSLQQVERSGGDRIDFSGGTFNAPVQGKGVQHITYHAQPE
ncbi:hypothetical protein ACIRSU_00045 [Streptomyces sp. NPDC101160]|uniref:hypothetical protein n=1 Tax=Streptomyces sp. NPDC101160 TaxID=3366118 RepID=UPI00381C3FFF